MMPSGEPRIARVHPGTQLLREVARHQRMHHVLTEHFPEHRQWIARALHDIGDAKRVAFAAYVEVGGDDVHAGIMPTKHVVGSVLGKPNQYVSEEFEIKGLAVDPSHKQGAEGPIGVYRDLIRSLHRYSQARGFTRLISEWPAGCTEQIRMLLDYGFRITAAQEMLSVSIKSVYRLIYDMQPVYVGDPYSDVNAARWLAGTYFGTIDERNAVRLINPDESASCMAVPFRPHGVRAFPALGNRFAPTGCMYIDVMHGTPSNISELISDDMLPGARCPDLAVLYTRRPKHFDHEQLIRSRVKLLATDDASPLLRDIGIAGRTNVRSYDASGLVIEMAPSYLSRLGAIGREWTYVALNGVGALLAQYDYPKLALIVTNSTASNRPSFDIWGFCIIINGKSRASRDDVIRLADQGRQQRGLFGNDNAPPMLWTREEARYYTAITNHRVADGEEQNILFEMSQPVVFDVPISLSSIASGRVAESIGVYESDGDFTIAYSDYETSERLCATLSQDASCVLDSMLRRVWTAYPGQDEWLDDARVLSSTLACGSLDQPLLKLVEELCNSRDSKFASIALMMLRNALDQSDSLAGLGHAADDSRVRARLRHALAWCMLVDNAAVRGSVEIVVRQTEGIRPEVEVGGSISVKRGKSITGMAKYLEEPVDPLPPILIYTIKAEEKEAVSRRYKGWSAEVIRGRDVQQCTVDTAAGAQRVLLARGSEQGPAEAQDMISRIIADADPSWVLVVGICGCVPNELVSLGDVVLVNKVVDMSVHSISPNDVVQYVTGGGGVQADVMSLATNISNHHSRLRGWNHKTNIRADRPAMSTKDIERFTYAKEEGWKAAIHDNLSRVLLGRSRPTPRVAAAPAFSSGALLKNDSVAAQWKKLSKHTIAVEMEMAGAFKAVHSVGNNAPRLLGVRGVSDVVGVVRDEAWTRYACDVAASMAVYLIKSGLLSERSVDERNGM